MSPRWSLRASSPQLPKLGMELKINTMDGELIEVGSSEAARKVILLHGLTGTGSVNADNDVLSAYGYLEVKPFSIFCE